MSYARMLHEAGRVSPREWDRVYRELDALHNYLRAEEAFQKDFLTSYHLDDERWDEDRAWAYSWVSIDADEWDSVGRQREDLESVLQFSVRPRERLEIVEAEARAEREDSRQRRRSKRDKGFSEARRNAKRAARARKEARS